LQYARQRLRWVQSLMRTLVDLLAQSAEDHGSAAALSLHGRAAWTWSYSELWDQSRRAASYLRAEGVGKGDRVVFWGPNRPEWVAAFFGAQILGAIVVPLDLRSNEDLLDAIETQTQPRYLVLGSEQAAGMDRTHGPATQIEQLRERLENVVPIDIDPGLIGPDDIAELVFTSGTTGNPKGVILSHRNIIANTKSGAIAIPPTPANRVLSLLPLSHMFEQTTGLFMPLSGGSSITYVTSLRPDTIFQGMSASHTTNMCCVPQVLELFREGILREVRKQGRLRRFQLLLRVASRLPLGLRRRLFRQVHQRMGGELEYLVSGGAYLDPGLARWWEALGFKIVQGYGMTEASPVVACHTVAHRDPMSVGRPLTGVELKIAEDGEVLVRGENITRGYWQNPQATAEAFADGWYKTGDLGAFDRSGSLQLRGRKKNMIVLANGMNVYPEDVEHVLTQDPRLKDAVVLGKSRGQDVEVHAVLLGATTEDAPAIIKAANLRLQPYQQIRGHTLWPDEAFPMTPTLKVKRAMVAETVATPQRQDVQV
jgi:long-chain acyl-CoA synthetase